jgi:hypothetical protein
MTALAPGVKVKCIKDGVWKHIDTGLPDVGPPKNSIWTVLCFSEIWGREYIILTEWHDWHQAFKAYPNFVPLDGNEDISALTEALNKGPVEGYKQDERVRIVERVR